MIITRKESLELADCLLETIIQEGVYTYWVKFQNIDIPFATCITVLKQFIRSPEQTFVEVTVRKPSKK